MFNLTPKNLPRTLALTLASRLYLSRDVAPAHATNGRAAAQMCIERDDCTITPDPNGVSFTITLDGGGVIWCPDVNGECVVVSPDKGKVGRHPSPPQSPRRPSLQHRSTRQLEVRRPQVPIRRPSANIPRHPSRSAVPQSCFIRFRSTIIRFQSTTSRSVSPPLRLYSSAAASERTQTLKPIAR